MRRDGRFQLADHVAGVAELAAARASWVSRSFSRASSSRARCGTTQSPSPAAEQDLAAEQRQRRRAQVGGAAVVAGLEQPRRGCSASRSTASASTSDGSTASV